MKKVLVNLSLLCLLALMLMPLVACGGEEKPAEAPAATTAPASTEAAPAAPAASGTEAAPAATGTEAAPAPTGTK